MIRDQSPQLLLVPVSPRSRIKMLKQMAAALEAEAAGLCRKASSFEEEESLLGEEIRRQQAELRCLIARLESLRSERNELLDRIETVTNDALDMREEVSNNEDDLALESLIESPIVSAGTRARRVAQHPRRRWRDTSNAGEEQ